MNSIPEIGATEKVPGSAKSEFSAGSNDFPGLKGSRGRYSVAQTLKPGRAMGSAQVQPMLSGTRQINPEAGFKTDRV